MNLHVCYGVILMPLIVGIVLVLVLVLVLEATVLETSLERARHFETDRVPYLAAGMKGLTCVI